MGTSSRSDPDSSNSITNGVRASKGLESSPKMNGRSSFEPLPIYMSDVGETLLHIHSHQQLYVVGMQLQGGSVVRRH